MIPQDDDHVTGPQQRRAEPQRPRLAPAEVLFDRPRRNEHLDVLDALAALVDHSGNRC